MNKKEALSKLVDSIVVPAVANKTKNIGTASAAIINTIEDIASNKAFEEKFLDQVYRSRSFDFYKNNLNKFTELNEAAKVLLD